MDHRNSGEGEVLNDAYKDKNLAKTDDNLLDKIVDFTLNVEDDVKIRDDTPEKDPKQLKRARVLSAGGSRNV